jgi:hypothetical protein
MASTQGNDQARAPAVMALVPSSWAPAGASRELTGYVAEHLGRLAMMVVIVDRKTA